VDDHILPSAKPRSDVRGLAFFLFVVLVVTPLASGDEDPGCVIFLQPSGDFRTLTFRADLVLNSSQRRAEAALLDGDGDGIITESEIADVDAASKRFFRGADDELRAILLDDVAPNVTLVSKMHAGWAGSVVTANGTVSEDREYRYDAVPERNGPGVRVLTGGVPPPSARLSYPVVETVDFIAPDGWLVYEVNGTRHGETKADIPHFDLKASWIVVFAQPGVDPHRLRGGGMPGPSAVATIMALSLVALLAGRSLRSRR
jgi:hypothetical protein